MFRENQHEQFEDGVRLLKGKYNMGVGGATCASYRCDAAFEALKYSNADIVLLTCGGNDLDLPGVTTDGKAVICDLLTMFTELEAVGKVVFFVAIPIQFSKRNRDPARGRKMRKQ